MVAQCSTIEVRYGRVYGTWNCSINESDWQRTSKFRVDHPADFHSGCCDGNKSAGERPIIHSSTNNTEATEILVQDARVGLKVRPQLLFLPLTQPGVSGKPSTAEAAVTSPPSGSGRTVQASMKSRDEIKPINCEY